MFTKDKVLESVTEAARMIMEQTVKQAAIENARKVEDENAKAAEDAKKKKDVVEQTPQEKNMAAAKAAMDKANSQTVTGQAIASAKKVEAENAKAAEDAKKKKVEPLAPAAPSSEEPFGAAFANARSGGLETFVWNGKKYSTKREDESPKEVAAPAPAAPAAAAPAAAAAAPAAAAAAPAAPAAAAPAAAAPAAAVDPKVSAAAAAAAELKAATEAREKRFAELTSKNKEDQKARIAASKTPEGRAQAHIESGERKPMGDSDNAQYRSHNDPSNGGSGDTTPEKKTDEKPSLWSKVKKFGSDIKSAAEELPGYNAATGEQTGFDKDAEGKYKKKFVGKPENTNILGLPENYTFIGRLAELVESSYTLSKEEKYSIIDNLQEGIKIVPRVPAQNSANTVTKSSDTTKEKKDTKIYHPLDTKTDDQAEDHLKQKFAVDEGIKIVPKSDNTLKLKLSKTLSGVGIAPEDSYAEYDTGRGKAYSLKDNANKNEKESYKRAVDSEKAKKFDLSGVTEDYSPLDESIEVSSDYYSYAHGKRPSGHGKWVFTPHRSGVHPSHKEGENYISVTGKFSDAKQTAQRWAQSKGHSKIHVAETVEYTDELTEGRKAKKTGTSSIDIMRSLDAIRAKQQAARDADEWGGTAKKPKTTLKSFTQSVRGSRYGGSKQKDDVNESFVNESAMSDLHQTIGEHMDEHIDNYKRYGGSEHLMSKAGDAAQKISKSHDINIEHAHKFVRDYIESNVGE